MTRISGWLTWKVSSPVSGPGDGNSPQCGVFISAPKRCVAKAVVRNRLKRLIREAVRKDDFFKNPDRVFVLRVGADPGEIKLNDVIGEIRRLKETI